MRRRLKLKCEDYSDASNIKNHASMHIYMFRYISVADSYFQVVRECDILYQYLYEQLNQKASKNEALR